MYCFLASAYLLHWSFNSLQICSAHAAVYADQNEKIVHNLLQRVRQQQICLYILSKNKFLNPTGICEGMPPCFRSY